MRNRKTLYIDSKKFSLLVERMDKKYTYEESINKIRGLIVEGPGKRLNAIINSGGSIRIDIPISLKRMSNIFDVNRPVDFGEIDGVLNRGVDGIKEDFASIGKKLKPLDEKSLNNVFSYLQGIKDASDGAGDALININKNLKNNTNLDLNQRIEFIDEVYKDNPSVLDGVYPNKTDLNNVKNRNGEFNSRDAIESRIKNNFLSLDLDDIQFLYKNSTYRFRFNPKKLFSKLNLKSGDLIVWNSSWGKGKYYIIPFEDTNPTLIKTLEDAGYKTYTESSYQGIEDSLPTGGGSGGGFDPNKPLKFVTPGKSKFLDFLLGNKKGGGWGGFWVRNKKGKAVWPSYIFMTGSKLLLLTIECTAQSLFGSQKINRLVDSESEEYTFTFGDCFLGGKYETADGSLEGYEPWFYMWHGYNIVIPTSAQVIGGIGWMALKKITKERLKVRQEEYINRFRNDLNREFAKLSIRGVLSYDSTKNINTKIDEILNHEGTENYFKVIQWVSGVEYNEDDVKEFILHTIDGVTEAELEGKEKQEEVREKLEEELGYQIQINNDISKEGDSPYDIEINNLKQSYIDQSKMLKGKIINEKLEEFSKEIDGEPEELEKLCKDMEVKLDLYSDNGWEAGESLTNLSDDNCKDSKEKLGDIIYVMETNGVKGYEGLKEFTKGIKCNLLILKDSYDQTCINNIDLPILDVEKQTENGKVTKIMIPVAEYTFQEVKEVEEGGKKVYKVGAGFDSTDLLMNMLSMAGSIIKDPKKGIKFLNDNGLEYKVGQKDTSREGKFCVKLTEKNLRTLETYGTGGFCSKSADKSKCINALIETINNDEFLSKEMNTWNGCEYGWE